MSVYLEELRDEETKNRFIDLEATFNAQGMRYIRWATIRFDKEQYALWCQGRKPLYETNNNRIEAGLSIISESENKNIVTSCDGYKIKSQHQFGNAVDYVILDRRGNPTWDYINFASEYRALRDIGTTLGFNCGGSWMKHSDSKDSEYIKVNLGWDPPHIQLG